MTSRLEAGYSSWSGQVSLVRFKNVYTEQESLQIVAVIFIYY